MHFGFIFKVELLGFAADMDHKEEENSIGIVGILALVTKPTVRRGNNFVSDKLNLKFFLHIQVEIC